MEPVDLTAFLQQAVRVRHDLLFLCLLADVWEPHACRALADQLVRLPPDYTARDLERRFVFCFQEMNTQLAADAERNFHLDILAIGGACRHFGLRCLGKRLGLLTESLGAREPENLGQRNSCGAAGPAACNAPKRRKMTKSAETPLIPGRLTLGKSDKDLFIHSGSSVVLALLSFARKEGVKHWTDAQRHAKGNRPDDLLTSIEKFVFDPSIPHQLQWGRQRATYHGQHICRKVWLVEYHGRRDGQTWVLSSQFVRDMGPDKNSYISKLPAGRLFKMFKPVDPTRLHMWCCLLGLCFKETYAPGFAAAWEKGRIDVDLWDRCRQTLLRDTGCVPHPVHVARECMRTLSR